ncbi:hypothetical protein GCM10027066_02980 [Dyella jejuensis]
MDDDSFENGRLLPNAGSSHSGVHLHGAFHDLSALASEERAKADHEGRDEALHSIHIGLDTTMWQLVRTCFWHQPPETAHGVDAYDLEYLAFPRVKGLGA